MADADLAAVPQPLRRGDPSHLGPFRLLGRLGAGGMGVVYVGVDASGRQAAVKLAREEYAEDRVFRARFAREVAAAQRVSGRFTASVYGASIDGDRPWMATELVHGPSLGALLERHGALGHRGQRALAAGLAEALVAIHGAGLVHRDLKPNNVLCAPDGPRVIDFGIAVAGDSSRLTQVGMVLGSPAWMSPEHLRGGAVGPAADVFGWGLLVAYAATGRSVFGEGDPSQMLHRVLYGVPDLGRPGMLAPDLRPLVVASLSRDPGQRPHAATACAVLAGLPTADAARAAAGAGALVDRTWEMPWGTPGEPLAGQAPHWYRPPQPVAAQPPEPRHAGLGHAGLGHVEPEHVEPEYVEPEYVEADYAELHYAEPDYAEPHDVEPEEAGPAHAGPAHAGPEETGPEPRASRRNAASSRRPRAGGWSPRQPRGGGSSPKARRRAASRPTVSSSRRRTRKPREILAVVGFGAGLLLLFVVLVSLLHAAHAAVQP